MNKKGFTLLELLVVVLIIGILAAIALPQYRVAVLKARMMKAWPIVNAIDKAQRAYMLANGGTWSTDVDELAIDMPPGATVSGRKFSYSDGMLCTVASGDHPSVGCWPDRAHYNLRIEKYLHPIASYYTEDRGYGNASTLCWASQTSSIEQKVCRSLGGRQVTHESATAYLYLLD